MIPRLEDAVSAEIICGHPLLPEGETFPLRGVSAPGKRGCTFQFALKRSFFIWKTKV
jgi:hypothetical protein